MSWFAGLWGDTTGIGRLIHVQNGTLASTIIVRRGSSLRSSSWPNVHYGTLCILRLRMISLALTCAEISLSSFRKDSTVGLLSAGTLTIRAEPLLLAISLAMTLLTLLLIPSQSSKVMNLVYYIANDQKYQQLFLGKSCFSVGILQRDLLQKKALCSTYAINCRQNQLSDNVQILIECRK